MALPFKSMACRQWFKLALFIASVFSMSSVNSFQITMEYRPPVKSSVSKLHDRRGIVDSRFQGLGTSGTLPSRSSSYQSAHAMTYSTPASSPSPAASFERRMRNLVLGNSNTNAKQRGLAPSQHKAPAGLPPNVHMVHNLHEYKQLVGDEKSKMVVVRFYATWCRACKAVAPLFYRMAVKHPDVVFVDVPVTEQNVALHQGLGVPSLPYAHIYHPQSGLVEETKLTRKHIQAFEAKLDCYLQGNCDLSSEDLWLALSNDDGVIATHIE